MRILIAGGGSGGHIHPALAVARALHEGPAPVDVVWVGGRRGLERELVPAAGFPLTRLWLRSEVFRIHTGFSAAAALFHLIQWAPAKTGSPD